MKGQCESFEICLIKDKCSFIIPVPVEVEVHTVPHFKAPVNGKVDPRGPEHGGIFIL